MPVHRLDRRATGLNSAARTWAGTGCHARLPVQEHGDGDLTAPCPCRRIRAAKRMALDPPATHEFVRPAHQALVWSLSVAAWAGGRSHLAGVKVYIQPTVTFVYPVGRAVSEETPVRDVAVILRSALAAEQQTARFAAAGRRGVVLRLGLLDGPGTGKDHPNPSLGATLHAEDAGRALLAALAVPSGIYNVCRDGERVSNRRFAEATGWRAPR